MEQTRADLETIKLSYGFDGDSADDDAVAHCLRLNKSTLIDRDRKLHPVRHYSASQKTFKLRPRAVEAMVQFCEANGVCNTHAIREALFNTAAQIRSSNVVRLLA